MNALTDEISGADPELEQVDLERTGRDLLPEYTRYKDEGCEYARSCLECPFPRCLYDEPRGRQQWLKELRNREINRLSESGRTIRELAMTFDVCERTVQRALKGENRKFKKAGKQRRSPGMVKGA
jgi:hypothetical protein